MGLSLTQKKKEGSIIVGTIDNCRSTCARISGSDANKGHLLKIHCSLKAQFTTEGTFTTRISKNSLVHVPDSDCNVLCMETKQKIFHQGGVKVKDYLFKLNFTLLLSII